MRIREIRVHQLQLPLKKPYRVSFRTYTALEPIIVEMRGERRDRLGRGVHTARLDVRNARVGLGVLHRARGARGGLDHRSA
jgi:hypothetical protein